jgi:hypothetical protein
MPVPQISSSLQSTREAMHRLAEHVLSPARHAVTGRIGLRPAPGGFETPPFGPTERVVGLDGLELVVGEAGPDGEGVFRRSPITTLRAAAEFVGVAPGAPADVYTPTTPLTLDAPLVLDPGAARLLTDWFVLGDEALAAFAAAVPEDDPGAATLWPEHFDLALTAARVNYGFSPGDGFSPVPYAYVGPHGGPPARGGVEFWNAPFGAIRHLGEITSVEQAVEFLHEGRARLLRPS